MPRHSVETLLSWLLTIAAVAIAGTMVHREFFASPVVQGRSTLRRLESDTWERILASGRRIGSPDAKVTIVEFTDFECPYCRRFHERWQRLSAERGSDVALVVVHYPLEAHRNALPTARAAECAASQGKFGDFVDAAFAKQDSLGIKSNASLALDAGVPDTLAFTRCLRDTKSWKGIDEGLALGKKIDLLGTPTVLVNGMFYGAPPTDSEFVDIFAKAVKR